MRIIYLGDSQLQEGNQNCTQQSLSAFYYHPTLLNDAMILQRDGWNTKCQSRVRAVELKSLTSHRNDVVCCYLYEREFLCLIGCDFVVSLIT